MDRKLEEHYTEQFSMFSTAAWKDFVEDCEKMKTEYSNILSVTDAKALHSRQGQIDILNWVINRKEMYEAAWKQIQEEAEADSA